MSLVTDERVRREILARFNPIRGLTPDVLAARLDSFRVGYLRELAITWETIEGRDINLKNVASKRKKAVSRCDWEILTVDDSEEAAQQKAALKYFYNNLTTTAVMEQNERGGVSLLLRQMMDAIGKRFAVHEIVWKPQSSTGLLVELESGETPTSAPGASMQLKLDTLLTAEFRFCPLWFFENRTGRLRFIEQPFGVEGVEMPDGEWMVTVGDGIMEACCVAAMFKSMALKDWVAFSEKVGLPGVIGKTNAAKDSAEWEQMVTAVSGLVNDWSAVMNKDDEIVLLEAKGGTGNLPFPPLVEYMDRKIASVWRGADLSTISQGGAGLGASLQGDEADLLLEDDTQLATETLNAQVDPFVIRYLFGSGAQKLAYIKILAPKKKNLDQELKVDTFLVSTGAPISIESAMERYGRPIADPGEPVLHAPAPAAGLGPDGRSPSGGAPEDPALANERLITRREMLAKKFETRAREMLVKAVTDDLQPVRTRLARILEIEDPEVMRGRLVSFLADLPKLKKSINADPESAKVLEETMSAALVNGFSEEAK